MMSTKTTRYFAAARLSYKINLVALGGLEGSDFVVDLHLVLGQHMRGKRQKKEKNITSSRLYCTISRNFMLPYQR